VATRHGVKRPPVTIEAEEVFRMSALLTRMDYLIEGSRRSCCKEWGMRPWHLAVGIRIRTIGSAPDTGSPR